MGRPSYTQRSDVPELTHEGTNRTVPMRVDNEFSIASEDPDPRGYSVIAADDEVAGTVSDLWVDRTSTQARWLEVALPAPAARA